MCRVFQKIICIPDQSGTYTYIVLSSLLGLISSEEFCSSTRSDAWLSRTPETQNPYLKAKKEPLVHRRQLQKEAAEQ